jgi:hypothetical protein
MIVINAHNVQISSKICTRSVNEVVWSSVTKKNYGFFFVFFCVILVREIKLGRKYFLIIPKHETCLWNSPDLPVCYASPSIPFFQNNNNNADCNKCQKCTNFFQNLYLIFYWGRLELSYKEKPALFFLFFPWFFILLRLIMRRKYFLINSWS